MRNLENLYQVIKGLGKFNLEEVNDIIENSELRSIDEIDDRTGKNLLHLAVLDREYFLVELFLKLGAQVNVKTKPNREFNKEAKTALRLLLSNGNIDDTNVEAAENIKLLLLDYGADRGDLGRNKEEQQNLEVIQHKFGIGSSKIARSKKNLVNEKIIKECAGGNAGLEPMYQGYYRFLQGKFNQFVLQLKTGTSELVKPESNIIENAITEFNKYILKEIPLFGNFLSEKYVLLANREELAHYKQYINFLSSHFYNNGHIDEVGADFCARMTAYYAQEILTPDDDRSFLEEMQELIDRSSTAVVGVERELILSVASFVTSLPKEEIAAKYIRQDGVAFKEHWEVLAAETILKFLEYLRDNKVSYDSDLGVEAANSIIPDYFSVPLVIDTQTQQFSATNAYSFGVISQLLYASQAQICHLTKKWGFEDYQVVRDDYLQSVIMTDSDKMILAFRGTHHDINWLKNLNAIQSQKITVRKDELSVHAGFYEALSSVWSGLSSKIQEYVEQHLDAKIYITGHSLGGAMAAIGYCELLNLRTDINIENIALYTYGQPLWCAAESTTLAQRLFNDNYYRIVNYLDIVPKAPPVELGYVHIGRQYYLDKEHLLQGPGIIAMTPADNMLSSLLYIESHKMHSYLKKLRISMPVEVVDATETEKWHSLLGEQVTDSAVHSHKAIYPSLLMSSQARTILIKSQDINYKTNDTGLTLLHIAASEGDIEIVDILLRENRDILNSKDTYDRTALSLAASNNHPNIAIKLLQHNASCEDYFTLLSWASSWGYAEIINLALESALTEGVNIDLEERHCDGKTVLFIASMHGHLNAAKELVRYGADVNTKDMYRGISALDIALMHGHLGVAQLLIVNSADYTPERYMRMDNNENSLLHLCCIYDDLEDLYLAIVDDFTNEINRKNLQGHNVYDLALEKDRIKIIEDIFYNRRVEGLAYDEQAYYSLIKNENDKTLAEIYKTVGHKISIKEARHGIDINKVNEKGNTLLYELIVQEISNEKEWKQKLNNIETLLKSGATLRTVRDDGWNVLHLVTSSKQNEILDLLKKANLPNFSEHAQAKDIWERSPVDIAEIYGFEDMLGILGTEIPGNDIHNAEVHLAGAHF